MKIPGSLRAGRDNQWWAGRAFGPGSGDDWNEAGGMRLGLQIVVVGLLAAALGGAWYWSEGAGAQSKEAPAKRPRAAVVLTEATVFAEDRVVIRATGTAAARRAAAIHPSVSGEVMAVTFTAGQKVAKGATLLRLDDTHERLAVRLAEVAVKEARRQLTRLEQLAPRGATSVARLQTAQAELETAIVRQQQAQADLADRTIYAPFDGVIGLTEVEVGDRITEDSLIATLDDRSALLIEFDLPEEYARGLAPGAPVMVRPWKLRDAVIAGQVAELGSRIDPVTRSLRVKARVPNADDAIRPGASFEVETAFTGSWYPAVREVAVLWSRDGAYLWRAKDGKADKVFVKIVRRDGGRILVDGPLERGDAVVVEGVQGLRPGQPVKARPVDDTADRPGAKP